MNYSILSTLMYRYRNYKESFNFYFSYKSKRNIIVINKFFIYLNIQIYLEKIYIKLITSIYNFKKKFIGFELMSAKPVK